MWRAAFRIWTVALLATIASWYGLSYAIAQDMAGASGCVCAAGGSGGATRDSEQRPASGQARRTASAATEATDPIGLQGLHVVLAEQLNAARAFLREVAVGLPELPGRLGVARERLAGELAAYGWAGLLVPALGFVLMGFLFEFAFNRVSRRGRNRIVAMPVDTVEQRLKGLGYRTLYGLGMIGAFTLGSVGASLAFEWPPLTQAIVLAYLVSFLTLRLTLVAGRLLLAPGAPKFRVLPADTRSARYWFVASATIVGLFAFIKATYDLMPQLGIDEISRMIVGMGLGGVLLIIALAAIWGRPPPREGVDVSAGVSWVLSGYLVTLWLSILTGATTPFFVGVTALVFILANVGLRAAIHNLVRPGRGAQDSAASTEPQATPIGVIALDRIVRIGLILVTGAILLRILDIDTSRETAGMRIARSGANVVIILLIAELAWQVFRGMIDRMITGVRTGEGDDDDRLSVRHRQRLRTLLPIFRHALLVVLATVAVLMALSSLGIEIAPLIAGAGIVGVAIGFGSQTLVKDIISGMFFLFDDAFRIGEYIESGRIKGTVEGFSLRSVKLRHHRGPLHTVPFGALTTITNYSRDWVIDKLTLTLPYDVNLVRVKQIIKSVGKSLQEDPEFAPNILETLKMQGVEDFADYGIQIRLKMMTRPGEQFTIRRRAYAMIKEGFEADGIAFAFRAVPANAKVTETPDPPGKPATGVVMRNA